MSKAIRGETTPALEHVEKAASTYAEDDVGLPRDLSERWAMEGDGGRLIDYQVLYEAYRLIDVVRSCVTVISSDALDRAPYLVEAGTEREADEDTQRTFNRLYTSMVNDHDSFRNVIYRHSNDLGIYDDAWIEVAPPKGSAGGRSELYTPDARFMFVQTDEFGGLIRYYQKAPSGTAVEISNPIIHSVEHYTGSRRYGMSPLLACLTSISTYHAIWRYLQNHYARSAVPKGVMMYTGVSPADWDRYKAEKAAMDAKDPMKTRNSIRELRAGDKDAKAQWTAISGGPADVQEHLMECRRAVMLAYRVPAIKLGMAEEGKMTASEIQVSNYDEVVRRRQTTLASVITRILPYYNIHGFEARFMDPKDSDRLRQSVILMNYSNAGILTIDEARREIDYDPLPDGAGSEARQAAPGARVDLPNTENPMAAPRLPDTSNPNIDESPEE